MTGGKIMWLKKLTVIGIIAILALIVYIFTAIPAHVSVRGAEFSPDGSHIIVGIEGGNKTGIYRIKLEDMSFSRLTTDKMRVENPSYSPDGKKIVFNRFQDTKTSHLFLMDANGAYIIQLTKGKYRDISPKFSKDGKKIYFIRVDDTQGEVHSGMRFHTGAICAVSLNSLEVQNITGYIYDCGGGISISKHGETLLINANKKGQGKEAANWMAPMRIIQANDPEAADTLVLPDIKQFNPRNTIPTDSAIRGADFLPNGESIVFSGFLKLQNTKGRWMNDSLHSVYTYGLKTGQVAKIIETKHHYGDGPKASPDGKKIVFCTGSPYSITKIWIANIDGSDLQNIPIKIGLKF